VRRSSVDESRPTARCFFNPPADRVIPRGVDRRLVGIDATTFELVDSAGSR